MQPSDPVAPAMRRVVPPPGPLVGEVRVPPSKSIANRALICAALAEGTSDIGPLPTGSDTETMLRAVSQWAVTADVRDAVARIVGNPEGALSGGVVFGCALAGTTSRFLTACAALGKDWSTVDGEGPLQSRPNEPLLRALEALGADVERIGRPNLPVRVRRGRGRTGGRVVLDASVSSQFVSALMLAGPLFDDGVVLELSGQVVSRPYIEMTAHVMSLFGADVEVAGAEVRVEPGGYLARHVVVEGDYSSAAFPLVAPVLRPGTVDVTGLSPVSVQSDAAILPILSQFGAKVEWSGDRVRVRVSDGAALVPVSCNLRACSDLLPALCVAASAVGGTSVFEGVGFVRSKESDRLEDLATELSRFGVDCDVASDGIAVHGNAIPRSLASVTVFPHHDHRLAMSLALMALRHGPVLVEDPDAVGKSWPTYWRDMESLLGS
jgi:3-phosphoshikimate 1-carboxyvinyltransferase